MSKYRKRPVVIEAFKMTRERRLDNTDWPWWLVHAFAGERGESGTLQRVHLHAEMPDELEIVTLEGNHRVTWGDFIIQGVAGELYPCKPGIFAVTYEAVDASEPEVDDGSIAVEMRVRLFEEDGVVVGWATVKGVGNSHITVEQATHRALVKCSIPRSIVPTIVARVEP